ncbi:methyltransferase [Robiginitalea sp. M366]|uniref:tRNA1(Val) (adenine(37)-N6)-methyltransferase n=1 Tax=Robiginitalea aestuariiviva TaxID=3036903 RepID=UPI00240E5396|nr:methyltransferase [Robiginitalea aestuariiviva]MDG1571132.1 methyltransferase [Robiginitalea aestuariiviva]
MSVFRFKQFQVDEAGAAMKVGTDGILLGAWAPVPGKARRILDVGTGNGLIALMLAQRCPLAHITGIDRDPSAAAQAKANMAASPWSERLRAHAADFGTYARDAAKDWDALVSNPPFYREMVSSGEPRRDQARQLRSLPFETLLEGADRLLGPAGTLSLILPVGEAPGFMDLAAAHSLYPLRLCRVRGLPDVPCKRMLLHLGRTAGKPKVSELIIAQIAGEPSTEFRALTRDYYLKM